MGALSHSLFVEDDATDLQFDSVGVGLGARYYFSKEARFKGGYVGAAGEALFIGFENAVDRYELKRRIGVALVEGGYRLRFGQFLVGGGARAGYAFELSSKCTPSAGANFVCAVEPWDSSVYGELALDVGFVF